MDGLCMSVNCTESLQVSSIKAFITSGLLMIVTDGPSLCNCIFTWNHFKFLFPYCCIRHHSCWPCQGHYIELTLRLLTQMFKSSAKNQSRALYWRVMPNSNMNHCEFCISTEPNPWQWWYQSCLFNISWKWHHTADTYLVLPHTPALFLDIIHCTNLSRPITHLIPQRLMSSLQQFLHTHCQKLMHWILEKRL